MSKLNRFQFIGNLGADAEVRTVNDNARAVISFSVAVTEKWKNAQGADVERTTWVRCSLWRKPDSTGIAQYLRKGQMVYIEGRPEARAYVDAAGEAKALLEVVVEQVQLLGGAPAGGGQPAAGAPAPRANNSMPQFGGAPLNQPPRQTPPPPTQWSQTPTAQQDDDLPF